MCDKIKDTFEVLRDSIESELKAYELELVRSLKESSKDEVLTVDKISTYYEKQINDKLVKFLPMIKVDASKIAKDKDVKLNEVSL